MTRKPYSKQRTIPHFSTASTKFRNKRRILQRGMDTHVPRNTALRTTEEIELNWLSVSVKWLAVKTASEMTYIVSGGALNSTHSLTHGTELLALDITVTVIHGTSYNNIIVVAITSQPISSTPSSLSCSIPSVSSCHHVL